MFCRWTRPESDMVVLEVDGQSGRGTEDSEISTLKELLMELEEEGLTDVTLNNHELMRGTLI